MRAVVLLVSLFCCPLGLAQPGAEDQGRGTQYRQIATHGSTKLVLQGWFTQNNGRLLIRRFEGTHRNYRLLSTHEFSLTEIQLLPDGGIHLAGPGISIFDTPHRLQLELRIQAWERTFTITRCGYSLESKPFRLPDGRR